jgi:hypothetical protein
MLRVGGVNLPIISRLSSIGRELYDRVVHRGEPAHPVAPLAVNDSEPTTRFARGDSDTLRIEGEAGGDDDDLEIAQDLGSLDVEQLAYGEDAETPTAVSDVSIKDGGDLYGVHIVRASDPAQLDDDDAFATGQNWVESLETRAAEGGPEPEHEVDIVDDNDLTSPSSDAKDRPVADRGSAGPRGL